MKISLSSIFFIALSVLVTCKSPKEQKAEKRFQPNLESLSTHNQSPEWFQNAKLGIYFTCGDHTVPAFGNEWYPYHMYRDDNNKMIEHHSKNLGILEIEQGGKKDLSESIWLTDVTLSNQSWCYVEGQAYKSAELVLRNMIDVWSKNGVVLLNCSPTANGVIPQEQRDVLHEIGEWMKKHEEAVYKTRPFDFYGFGLAKAGDGHLGGQSATVEYTEDDGRFLKSKDGKHPYLFMLGKPKPETEIRGLTKHDFYLDKDFKRITVMGSNVEAKWHFALRNFILTVPDTEMDENATVF